jgi:hypothetical protein
MDQLKEQAQAVSSLIDEIESQIKLLSQTSKEHEQGSQGREQTESSIASLRQLISELGKDPMGQSANDAFYFKLSSLEEAVEGVRKAGTSSPEALRALSMFTMGLVEDVGIKLGAVDDTAKDELRLYMENEGRLQNQFDSILLNIKRHMNRGDYDPNRAPVLWKHWVDSGAEAYVKEFPDSGKAITMFPTALRVALSKELADDYKEKIDNGEYDQLFERAKLMKDKSKKAGEGVEGLVVSLSHHEQPFADPKVAAEVEGPAEDVAKDMKVDDPYAGKDQSKNDTYYKLAEEEPPKVAAEGELPKTEVEGPAEDVAKQTKVDDPYAGKDQSKNDTYYKLAASEVPFINEALAHSVMAKVEGALRLVEASDKQGAEVAKQDLSIITNKLTSLLQASELGDPGLCTPLRELAGLADKVTTHFAS